MNWRKISAASAGGAFLAVSAVLGVAGCGDGNKTEEGKTEANKQAAAPAAVPTTGSHGGRIVALGDKAYHVEVVPDFDAEGKPLMVTFYLLDGTGTKRARVAALEIVANTKVGDKVTERKVFSAPDNDEYDGKTSRFRATDPKDAAAIMATGTEVELILTIGDKKPAGTYKNEPAAATASGTGSPTGTPSGTAAKPATTPAATPKPTTSATSATSGSPAAVFVPVPPPKLNTTVVDRPTAVRVDVGTVTITTATSPAASGTPTPSGTASPSGTAKAK